MPKRFTDTDKWMDAWFYSLKPTQKLIWLYALDSCNHAGVWKVNTPMMSGMIGATISTDDIQNVLSERIVKIDDDKFFIPKFLQFQYPKGLKVKVKAQASVIDTLLLLDLRLTLRQLLPKSYLSLCEGLGNTCLSATETDTDKEIDTDKDKDNKKTKPKTLKQRIDALALSGGYPSKKALAEKFGIEVMEQAAEGLTDKRWPPDLFPLCEAVAKEELAKEIEENISKMEPYRPSAPKTTAMQLKFEEAMNDPDAPQF